MSDETQKGFWIKSIFVFATVAFCLVVSAKMGFDQGLTTRVSEIVADGFISLAMFVSIAFLAAQAVDPSMISKLIGRRGSKAPPMEVPNYQSVDPSEYADPPPEAKG